MRTHGRGIGVLLFLRGTKGRLITSSFVGIGEKVASLGALEFGKRPALQRRTVAFCGARKPMQRSNPTGENPTDLPKRAVRALTEKMTVLPDTGRVRGADDLFLVVSESGSEYLVDTREGRCDCPDAHYNLEADERCKHERRVHYATGETSIPMWADTDAIDSHLGLQTTRSPVRAATDGGVVGEESGESFESHEETREDVAGVIEDEREECDCAELTEDFPCWPCVRDGRKELPE